MPGPQCGKEIVHYGDLEQHSGHHMADQEFRKFVGMDVCVYAWMDRQQSQSRGLYVYQQGHYFNSLYLDINMH